MNSQIEGRPRQTPGLGIADVAASVRRSRGMGWGGGQVCNVVCEWGLSSWVEYVPQTEPGQINTRQSVATKGRILPQYQSRQHLARLTATSCRHQIGSGRWHGRSGNSRWPRISIICSARVSAHAGPGRHLTASRHQAFWSRLSAPMTVALSSIGSCPVSSKRLGGKPACAIAPSQSFTIDKEQRPGGSALNEMITRDGT